ncbi:protein phosphatase regulator SHP1 NDAI_0E04250 [Naumovozyma dairenensis CBS 421]|uniref:UBX domain-containing protein n=1 Tax=Naumovozyma dairenensis (strain ATCC 10597 / BCRC 20456 / CBS 421 / NBRC 0211 / NRRL Y-12639) TaxID=1071378 RepID=G0WBX2_NAUDC|nr:hypothetical protein NDAI_0E04250 [Naumovozyma dairenensis CBS 421]CCD25242.1 hypothetical protein NDAI_0E04250 [Naumovozyma dairenensis CBS 421]
MSHEVTDDDIEQFIALTNSSPAIATQFLKEFGSVNEAINSYFATQTTNDPNYRSPPVSAIQRVQDLLSDADDSHNSGKENTPSSTKSADSKGSKFMSFSDMVRTQADEEDEDPDKPRNTFAGGETSGLEVTDPNDSNALIKDLLEKAKRGGEQMERDGSSDSPAEEQHHFLGRGYRLGSSVDAPSRVIEGDRDAVGPMPKRVAREITFWKEGFQVGDGELYRYDDPANSFYLKELNQGRAPLNLLNVEFGQEVDVNVHKKIDESFKPPKRKLGGFHGQGQRLGSPIPGESESSVEPSILKAKAEETTAAKTEVEEPKGDTSVQIRYASGKREVFRCYSTDKVQKLYDHVMENTQDHSRTFTLNHAFPVKPVENLDSTIKDADLVNSVVVQRWA